MNSKLCMLKIVISYDFPSAFSFLHFNFSATFCYSFPNTFCTCFLVLLFISLLFLQIVILLYTFCACVVLFHFSWLYRCFFFKLLVGWLIFYLILINIKWHDERTPHYECNLMELELVMFAGLVGDKFHGIITKQSNSQIGRQSSAPQ